MSTVDITILSLMGGLLALFVYFAVSSYLLYRAGAEGPADHPSLLSCCVLIAITLIMWENTVFGNMAVFLAASLLVIIATFEAIDNGALWLAKRGTKHEPQQKTVNSTVQEWKYRPVRRK